MRVGKYELLSKFATGGQGGGMGEIWLAHLQGPHGIRDTVVLKRLQVDVEERRNDFITEARLGMRLKHPHVARTFDAFEFDGQLWIAQDYIEGANGDELRKAARKGGKYAGRLTVEMIMLIGAHIAKALSFAHYMPFDGQWACIVHRDLTPDNIIVSCTGHTFVIDFGIAKARIPGRMETNRRMLKGKVAYLAPEMIDGHDADARVDVYGLGITLTELLTGEPAFPTNTTDLVLMTTISREGLPSLRSVEPSIPEDVAAFVEQIRHRDPVKRVQTAQAVYEGLMRMLKERGADIPDLEKRLGELATDLSSHRRRLSSPFVRLLPPREDSAPALAIEEQETHRLVEGHAGVTLVPFWNRTVAVQREKLIAAPAEKVEINLPELSKSKIRVYDRTSPGRRRPTVRLPESVARGALGNERARRRFRFVALVVVAAGVVVAAAAFRVDWRSSGNTEIKKSVNKEIQESVASRTSPPVLSPTSTVLSGESAAQLQAPTPSPSPSGESAAPVVGRAAVPVSPARPHRRKHQKESTAGVISLVGPDSFPPSTTGVIDVPASGSEPLLVTVDGVIIGDAPQQYPVSPGRHWVVVSAKEKGAFVSRVSQWVRVSAGSREVVGVR